MKPSDILVLQAMPATNDSGSTPIQSGSPIVKDETTDEMYIFVPTELLRCSPERPGEVAIPVRTVQLSLSEVTPSLPLPSSHAHSETQPAQSPHPNATSSSRSKRVVPCVSCRKTKKKCDGSKPRCRRYNIANKCVDAPSTKGKKTADIKPSSAQGDTDPGLIVAQEASGPLPVGNYAMPSAHPALHGPTSGVITSSQFNQGTYAPGTVDARTTQDPPPYPAGEVECQPGTGYMENPLAIAAQEPSFPPYNDNGDTWPNTGVIPGVTTSTQVNQSMYVHGDVGLHNTQALPAYVAGGVEVQPGAPGTVYSAGPSAAMPYYDPAMSQDGIENWFTHDHHGTNGYEGAAGPSNVIW